jgi:hypothetical protein
MGSEVCTAMTIKTNIFWNVMKSNPVHQACHSISIEGHKIRYLYVHGKHKILTDNYGEAQPVSYSKIWIFYQQYKKKLGRRLDPTEPLDHACYKNREKFFC